MPKFWSDMKKKDFASGSSDLERRNRAIGRELPIGGVGSKGKI